MCEQAMVTVRASVLLYDDNGKQWVPSGSSKQQEVSRVQLFQHVQQNTFRVVGRKLQDQEVVVNCAIGRGFRYNVTSETFHQWKDQQIVYGLNFISLDDAVTFGTAIAKAIEVVNTTSCGLPPQNTRPAVVNRPCPAPSRPLVNGNESYEDRSTTVYGQSRRVAPDTSIGTNVYAAAGYATVCAQSLHSPQKQTAVAVPPAPAEPPLSSAYPTVKRQATAVRKPPIVSNAPPPPPMPAAGAWRPTGSTAAKQTNLAEALATAKLRKVSAPASANEAKSSRSASVGSIESTVASSRSGNGIPSFGHSDVISEITATLARRKLLQEGGQLPAGSANELSETDGSKAEEIRKISDCRNSRAADSVSAHRKMPSGSSLSSQEEGAAAQGWQKGLFNGLCASNSTSGDLIDQLKVEVVQCIKEEINRAKLELIDCLRKGAEPAN
uniref:WH1 domain-containing protein n=1 Tax=Trichuris muris TaxID=70415 RepID=A0A5S6R308_TRIMR